MHPCRRRALLALLATGTVPLVARSQAWPARPIRVIVPFAAGGAVDAYMRAIAPDLSQRLGQSVLVENQAGAGGAIGATTVAKAAPDGYTLLAGNIQTLALNSATHARLPYDPLAQFAPIVHTVLVDYVIVLSPKVPARSLAEFIALARAEPGRFTYGTSGVGSLQHLAAELLAARTGMKLTHVAYKGTGAVVGDLVAGHVDFAFADQASMMPMVRAGKLRALAVGGRVRLADLPDVPTVAEAANLPGFEAVAWLGLAAPAGTPAPIVQRVNEVVNELQATPAIRGKLAGFGMTPVGGTPAAFGDYLRSELAKWTAVARDNQILAEP